MCSRRWSRSSRACSRISPRTSPSPNHGRGFHSRKPCANTAATSPICAIRLSCRTSPNTSEALASRYSRGCWKTRRTRSGKFAGLARTKLGEELNLIDKDRFELAWIVDFPMYEYNEDDKKVDFSHNPFSMPQGGLEALQTQDPLTIKAFQYDITCNGYEIASGGIRNHRPEAMVKAFEIAGYDEKDVVERFGGMYRAFQYGAPPHGGMAAGVDRIVMLLCGTTNLREISLFPMNQRAEDLLMGAPSEVTPKQLRELHIRLNLPQN